MLNKIMVVVCMENKLDIRQVIIDAIKNGTDVSSEIKQYASEHNLSDIVALIKEAEELSKTPNPAVQDLQQKLYQTRVGCIANDKQGVGVIELMSVIAADLGVQDDFPKFENKVAQDAGALEFKVSEINAMNKVFAIPEAKNLILAQAQADINRFRGKKDVELKPEEIVIRNTAQVVESGIHKFDAMAELLEVAKKAEEAVANVATDVVTEVKKDFREIDEKAQDFERYVLNKVKNHAAGITVKSHDSTENIKPTTLSGAILDRNAATKGGSQGR